MVCMLVTQVDFFSDLHRAREAMVCNLAAALGPAGPKGDPRIAKAIVRVTGAATTQLVSQKDVATAILRTVVSIDSLHFLVRRFHTQAARHGIAGPTLEALVAAGQTARSSIPCVAFAALKTWGKAWTTVARLHKEGSDSRCKFCSEGADDMWHILQCDGFLQPV